MKKSIRNIFLLFVLFFGGLQGCSFLDVDIPDNLVKDDYWKNKEQANAALMGVYTSLHDNLTQFIKWGDIRSELYLMGPKAKSGEEVQFWSQDIYTTNPLTKWEGVYKGINWTNSFLQNVRTTLTNDPSLTLEEVQGMESEAYAIRALYYFYLVRTFRDVPVSLEAYESDSQLAYGPAYSEARVLDVIEDDLKKAYEHAPSFSIPTEKYGRITLNAVRAIWADVKLWRKDYVGCVRLCEELDAEYKNKMVPRTEWFTIFNPGNSSESIFEYQYIDKGISSPLWGLYLTGSDNVFQVNMKGYSEEVLQLYPAEYENREYGDTVRTTTAAVLGMADGGWGEAYKYVGARAYDLEYRSFDNRRSINYIFYRYREILLIKAEALAMQGDYTNAVAAINEIRSVTGLKKAMVDDFGQEESFFDNLICERTAELAFEGKQWFSLVRMARNTGFSNLLIERIAKALPDNSTIKIQTMRARLLDPESWFLPYFDTEVEKNPLLEQKPYYKGKI